MTKYRVITDKPEAVRIEKTNSIVGQLLAMEKFKFVDSRIIAEVVREAVKIINEGKSK